MKGLSKKEIVVVSDLEFRKKYYFSLKDISRHFDDKKQMANSIYVLRKKGRIVKLNRNKFFLIPIKARTGKWTDNPLIVADEMLDGENYFIGGAYAAFYWKLSDQIPMQMDIFTTKRQGKKTLLNKKFVFHRTTKKKTGEAATQSIENHDFKIIGKEAAKKWLKSRK